MSEQDQESRTKNLQGAIEDLERELLPANRPAGIVADDVMPWVIEFRIVGTTHIIRAPVGETLIFGRRDERRNVHPEIDLTDYQGMERGVSRRHARLIVGNNRVTVEDLGSANGTFINGSRADIIRPSRVRDGDVLQLGNLKLQVHFIIKPNVSDDTMPGLGNEFMIPKIGMGQRLLLVDDNDDVSKVLRFVALRAGFEPVVAQTLADALAVIDEERVDSVIVEMLLAEGDGLNLVQYVRQKAGNKSLPVIAMSSDTSGYQEGQAFQAGVDMYLTKPLAVEELVDCLNKIMALMTS